MPWNIRKFNMALSYTLLRVEQILASHFPFLEALMLMDYTPPPPIGLIHHG